MSVTYRHKKRGTLYQLIGIGKMQAEHWKRVRNPGMHDTGWLGGSISNRYLEGVDMRDVAVYCSVIDPTEIWVRPREEFEDGRFEKVRAP